MLDILYGLCILCGRHTYLYSLTPIRSIGLENIEKRGAQVEHVEDSISMSCFECIL